jgi:excisionase family DNA binding protein
MTPGQFWRLREKLINLNNVLRKKYQENNSRGNYMRNDFINNNDMLSIEPLTVDVKTAAKMLNVCERTVRTLTKNGELPVVRIASRVLYSMEDLIEFIRQKSRKELSSERENKDLSETA